MKVIFHVDEMERWDLTLKNVHNFLTEVPDVCVEVLVNAEAVKIFENVNDLKQVPDKAKIMVCRNALKAHHIREEDLAPDIQVVPAGVVWLAERQHAGFAYIRP